MFQYIYIYGFSPKNKESFKRFYTLCRINGFHHYDPYTYNNILRQKTFLTYFSFITYEEYNGISHSGRGFCLQYNRPNYVKDMIALHEKSLVFCFIHIREINMLEGENLVSCINRIAAKKYSELTEYYRQRGLQNER